MNLGYRIAAVLFLALFGATWFASYYGWGLRSTASAQAEALRRRRTLRSGGTGYARGYYGGGYRYGK